MTNCELLDRAYNKCEAKIQFLKMETNTYFSQRHSNPKLGYDLMTNVVRSNIRDIRTWEYIKNKL